MWSAGIIQLLLCNPVIIMRIRGLITLIPVFKFLFVCKDRIRKSQFEDHKDVNLGKDHQWRADEDLHNESLGS